MAKRKEFKICLDGSWYNNESIMARVILISVNFARYIQDKKIEIMIDLKSETSTEAVKELTEFLNATQYKYIIDYKYLDNTARFVIFEYAEFFFNPTQIEFRFKESL